MIVKAQILRAGGRRVAVERRRSLGVCVLTIDKSPDGLMATLEPVNRKGGLRTPALRSATVRVLGVDLVVSGLEKQSSGSPDPDLRGDAILLQEWRCRPVWDPEYTRAEQDEDRGVRPPLPIPRSERAD